MTDLSQSLAALRADFISRGWHKKPTFRLLAELAVHVTLMVGGTLLFLLTSNPWLWAVAAVASAFGGIGIASNSHTSSHFATSTSRRVNELLTYFGYPFLLGFSASYWWADHVKGHHQAPNVFGVDNDFDYWPFFAVTEVEIARSHGARRFYYERLQRPALVMLIPLFGFNLQRGGLQYLVGRLRTPGVRKTPLLWDLAAIIAHFALFLVLPGLYFSWGAVAAIYCLRIALMGFGMFAILAPAHFPAMAPVLTPQAAAELDYVTLQTMTTIDMAGGPILTWLASGLEYQIEHHLFPEISHVHYKKLRPLVERFCRDHNLMYRRYGFFHALRETWRVFAAPKPVFTAVPEPVSQEA
jgi:fatty acid desaturase